MWLRDRSSLLLLSPHLCIGSSSTTPLGILGIQDHSWLSSCYCHSPISALNLEVSLRKKSIIVPKIISRANQEILSGEADKAENSSLFLKEITSFATEYGEAWGTFSKNSCGFVLVKGNWKDVGRCFGNIGQLDCRKKPRRQLSRAVLRSEHISNAGFRNCHFQRDWIWIDGSAQQFMPQGIVENNSEISQP